MINRSKFPIQPNTQIATFLAYGLKTFDQDTLAKSSRKCE